MHPAKCLGYRNRSNARASNERAQSQETTSLQDLIQDPTQLKMLILAGTDINISDMTVLSFCVNLIKLDLSSNKITRFPPNMRLSQLTHLKLLYLHENLISDIEPLTQLFAIPHLVYLTIFSNPICEKPGVRHLVVNSLKSLLALDFNVVNEEERNSFLIESKRFVPFAPSTKLKWPIAVYPISELLTEEQYIQLMKQELDIVQHKYMHNNPIILAQKLIRGFLGRARARRVRTKKSQTLQLIRRVTARWKKMARRAAKRKGESKPISHPGQIQGRSPVHG